MICEITKFGRLFSQKYDKMQMYDEGENVVNMNVNSNEEMVDENGRYLSIESYNYSPGLSQWGYEEGKNDTLSR